MINLYLYHRSNFEKYEDLLKKPNPWHVKRDLRRSLDYHREGLIAFENL
jgi:hypothetical protein